MTDFRKVLSPQALRQLDVMQDEVQRIFDLNDRWLAAELVRTARKVKSLDPDHYGKPGTIGHDLVTNVIPEIAARLGETKFNAGERGKGVKGMEDWELRLRAGACLEGAEFTTAGRTEDRPGPVELLLHEPANGNPVAIALDRVAPANDADDDYCATSVREVSRYRGLSEISMWVPDMASTAPAMSA